MTSRPLTAEKLKTLPALQGVVMETLRLYPVAALSQRTVTTPFTFGGYRVAAGTPLLIATGMTHVLPELFPDPARFDIDRYEAPRHEHRTRGAYAPYGLGAHVCLGAVSREGAETAGVSAGAIDRSTKRTACRTLQSTLSLPGLGFAFSITRHARRTPGVERAARHA